MPKLILVVALVAIGGFAFYYYCDGVFDCQYGSNTAKILEQIESLPPTAAGNLD